MPGMKKEFMNKISIKTFTAQFTLGFKAGYTEKAISMFEVKKAIADGQKQIFNETNIKLSAKVSPCEIIFSGQDEPSVELQFIQYPKFPIEETKLKAAIIQLATYMVDKLEQNRTVIIFQDETVMLEKDNAIDPRIKF